MVGENHRNDFRKRELSGSSREPKKQKRSSHGWKLRYEALRFQPFSIMLPLPLLSRVEMNAKGAPLTAAARAQEQCRLFLT